MQLPCLTHRSVARRSCESTATKLPQCGAPLGRYVPTMWWIGFAMGWGCGGVPLSEDQKAELQRLMVEAEARNAPLEARRKEVVLQAKTAVGPRPDWGACPIRPIHPQAGDLGSFADEAGITFQLSTAPISVVKAENLANSEGPRYDRITTLLINDVQGMLYGQWRAKSQAEIDAGVDRARLLADPPWLSHDATLVIDRYTAPVLSGTTFASGRLAGRMYLYSYADQAIVCMARVIAENSDGLGVHVHQDDAGNYVGAVSDLERDLFLQGVNRGLDAMLPAGPPIAYAVPVP